MLDRFDLNDNFILRLRNLARTVRSSRWEATLRTSDWGLSFEQAVSLSKALLLDTQASRSYVIIPKVDSVLYLISALIFYILGPFLLEKNVYVLHCRFFLSFCC